MTPEDSARLQQLESLRAELRDALAKVKWLTDENEALSVSLRGSEKRLEEANAALLALTQAFNKSQAQILPRGLLTSHEKDCALMLRGIMEEWPKERFEGDDARTRIAIRALLTLEKQYAEKAPARDPP